jgi:hypothetical protein
MTPALAILLCIAGLAIVAAVVHQTPPPKVKRPPSRAELEQHERNVAEYERMRRAFPDLEIIAHRNEAGLIVAVSAGVKR